MNKHILMTGLLLGLAGAAAFACDVNVENPTADGGAGTDGDDDDEGDGSGGADDDEGEGGGSREAQLCERADECGYLAAGYSLGDCTDIVESCTDDLLTSAHEDWNGWADECLGLNNCMNFGDCYWDIDVCTVYVEVEVEEDDDGVDPDGPPEEPNGPGGGCGGDSQACVDDWTIAACIDGDLYEIDCYEACLEGGWDDTVGCDFDPEAGDDMCLCV